MSFSWVSVNQKKTAAIVTSFPHDERLRDATRRRSALAVASLRSSAQRDRSARGSSDRSGTLHAVRRHRRAQSDRCATAPPRPRLECAGLQEERPGCGCPRHAACRPIATPGFAGGGTAVRDRLGAGRCRRRVRPSRAPCPDLAKPSFTAAAYDRSISRSLWNGPRSLTRTMRARWLSRLVTRDV